MAMTQGWIGVDLDGTLAHYEGWQGADKIGEPIPLMVQRVKAWLEQGKIVKIVTARVSVENNGGFSKFQVISIIHDWCQKHIGQRLPITHEKDFSMIELWDDRCVQVIPNTGKRADGKEPALIP
jgi:hypothetical protein